MSKRCIGYNDITKEYIYYDEESNVINSQKELEKDAETGLHTINDIWWKITKDFRDKNDVKDKQIADLEAKLAESERVAENNKKVAELVSAEHNAKIEKLKQQLAEKETRIAELEDKDWYELTIKQLEEQCERLIIERDNAELKLAEKEKELEKQKSDYEELHINFKDMIFLYDKVNAEHNQDKISLALEQLNQAKGKIQHNILFVNCDDYVNVIEEIDNQIEELKKEIK